uniref:Integrin_alpha2 domain-containing protein n=1 Tax=Steinernema glaseri TaxID=37863 RepID=A0A1I7Y884_9BILA
MYIPPPAEHPRVVLVDTEMLFLAIILLLLSQVGEATFEGKRYNLSSHTLQSHVCRLTQLIYVFLQLKVYSISRTRSQVFFGLGYTNEQSVVIYNYKNLEKHTYNDAVDSKDVSDVNLTVDSKVYEEVEQACFNNTNTQSEYNKCLTQPNIVHMVRFPLGFPFNRSPLTLEKIEVTVDVVRSDENPTTEITGHSLFLSTNAPLTYLHGYQLEASKNGERHAIIPETLTIKVDVDPLK